MKPNCAAAFIDSRNPGDCLGFRAFVIFTFLILVHLFSPAVCAHHGRDFILVQDSAIPSPFHGVAIGGYQWTRDGDNNAFSTEPGFFIGLTPALAFGLSADFSDDGDGWKYTGIMPQFVLSLLEPSGPRNVRIGLWAGYDFAEAVSFSSSVQTVAQNGGSGSGPDARRFSALAQQGPVVAHAGHGLSQGGQNKAGHGHGINRHGESGLYTRLILEADVTEDIRAITNFISFVPDDGSCPGFGYAAGLRHEVSHDLSFGVEALGEFLGYGSSHEVLLTTMIGLPKHLSLRFGIGGGLTNASSDFTLHTSFLWRF